MIAYLPFYPTVFLNSNKIGKNRLTEEPLNKKVLKTA